MKKKLLGLFTSVISTATAIPFLFANSGQVTKVSAATIEKTIYVDLSLNTRFLEDDANPYLHFSDKDIDLTLINNDIYRSSSVVSISDITNGFTICSFNGTYNTVTVSGDTLSKDNYNYVCVDSYISTNTEAFIDRYGYYGVKTPNPEPTYRTHRVWLYDNSDINDSWGNKVVNAAMYLDELSYKLTIMKDIYNKDGKIYYCVDLPLSVTSIHFVKLANTENHNYSIYRDVNVDTITYGICYYLNDLGYTYGSVSGADAYLLSEVVQAYLTYGDKPSNGSIKSTVKSLYNTWFANKSASDNELNSTKIWDYTGYNKETHSYEGYEKNAQFSVNEKWNAMCSQAGIDPKTGEDRTDLSSWFTGKRLILILAIAGSVLLIGGFAIFLIVKKKKAQNQ